MKFSPEDIELLTGVVEEINTHLDGLEDKIITMEKEKTIDAIKEVYRAFHSMKGLAGFGNLNVIVEITHKLENYIKVIMDGKEQVTSELVDLLLQSTDYIRSYINHIHFKINEHTGGELEITDIPGYEELEKMIDNYGKSNAEKPDELVRKNDEQVSKIREIEQEVQEGDFQNEILADYYEELNDNVYTLENEILEYEKAPSQDIVNSIMRTFHSIKGGTRLILSFPEYSDNSILRDIEQLSHRMEDIVLENIQTSTQLNTELILQSIDLIKHLVNTLKGNEEIDKSQIDSFKERIGLTVAVESNKGSEVVEQKEVGFSKEALKSIILQMNDFIDAFSINPDLSVDDFFRISEPVKKGLMKMNAEKEQELLDKIIEDITKKDYQSAKQCVNELSKYFGITQKKEESNKQPQQKIGQVTNNVSQSSQSISQFVRVEREKIEFLGNLAGEMITFKNELRYILKKVEQLDRKLFTEMKNIFGRFDKLSYDLQNGTMALRMTPVGELFGRFKRTVRDLAKSLNKKVNILTEGEDIQIDRNIIEMLVDPLTHMIRNAIDHGIENPEERIKAGKSEEGNVALRAYYSGNYAVIEVEDDGRGLDPEKIRYKAIEKGLVTPEEALNIPDEKIVYYIFEPGFSTKDTATEISGRGVGMDVVKTVANRVGGDVILSYVKGKGSKMGIKIPLSLMVLRGLLVEVLSERYVIPLEEVRETVKIRKNMIHRYKDTYFTNIRNELIPIIFVDEILFGKKLELDNKTYQFDLIPIVVIETGEKTFALAVDKFVEEGEYLIKNIPDEFKFGEVFTGATIMGDGSIVLIMDPKELTRI